MLWEDGEVGMSIREISHDEYLAELQNEIQTDGLIVSVRKRLNEINYAATGLSYANFMMVREKSAEIMDVLKAQEPRVMTIKELAFYESGLYVETRNGCPEGLTDEVWPALVHLYCVSQNDEYGYVSFVNWNADTYDFEAKDYNVEFRCWTSRPTDAQREAVAWE